MIRRKGKTLFGYLPTAPYREPTDTLEEMQQWKNETPVQDIITHIEGLEAAYMSGLGESRDAFTGEAFPAGIYLDGKFSFPVDVLRYLKQGTILNGRYIVGRVLGQGGFGITYIARDQVLDTRAAVKEFFPNGYAVRDHTATSHVTLTDKDQSEYILKGKEKFLRYQKKLQSREFKSSKRIFQSPFSYLCSTFKKFLAS